MPRAEAERKLARMLATVSHEQFYSAGAHVDEKRGLYVGWVARKGSFASEMPLFNEAKDIGLVFSGEEFSNPDAPDRMRAAGTSKPEYLVRAYEKDPSFFSTLNGRFHGVAIDGRRGIVVLFNDRFGMHRLYWYETRDAFYFAAEAKAILAVCPETRRVMPESLGEFISCGAVLEDRTLFKGVQLLPPASVWTFRETSPERGRYFHPREWEEIDTLSQESSYTALRDVFAARLPRYFSGPERVGMSLTGGLDTRMVMAWYKGAPGSLPCYTFGGMRRECRDVLVAREVARICGQAHETIAVDHDFLTKFPYYAERAVYMTDGCVDVSRAPDLFLSERARQIAPVRMTGLYGSEIVRGVRAFKPEEPLAGVFSSDMATEVRHAGETYRAMATGHPVTFAAFKQAPWHHYGSLALEQTQYSVRTPFLDNDLVRTVYQLPKQALSTSTVSLRLIADGKPELMRVPSDRGLGGRGGTALQALRHGTLEFLFKAEYAYDMGMPQWLARVDHSVSRLQLQNLFLGRHKIFHFRTWYRDHLAAYVQDVLLEPRSLCRPYLEQKAVRNLVQAHVKGTGNYTNEIHRLITLELLHRLFLDDTGTGGARSRDEKLQDLVPAYCGVA